MPRMRARFNFVSVGQMIGEVFLQPMAANAVVVQPATGGPDGEQRAHGGVTTKTRPRVEKIKTSWLQNHTRRQTARWVREPGQRFLVQPPGAYGARMSQVQRMRRTTAQGKYLPQQRRGDFDEHGV